MKRVILVTLLVTAVGAGALGFEKATEIVLDDVLFGLYEGTRVYGLEEKISEGTVVEAWHDSVVAPIDGYFFFIDPYPLANWEHPCQWVFVAADDGDATIYDMTTPPRDKVFVEMTEVTDPTPYEQPTYDDVREMIKRKQTEMFGEPRYTGDGDRSRGDRYALLISGGASQSNNHIRYWGDIAFIFCALKHYYGYSDSEIVVCMSDGDNPAVDRSNGTSSPLDLDGDDIDDYELDATYATVTEQLQYLVDNVSAGDTVFIFTTDHGGSSGGYNTYLNLWNWDTLADSTFASYIDDFPADTIKLFSMEQCFSGGFIDDLDDLDNVVIATAAPYNDYSWAGDTYPYFDQFAYEWTAAVNFYDHDEYPIPDIPESFYRTGPVDADEDDDGFCQMDEAYDWAYDHKYYQDNPQYEDTSGIGDMVDLFGDLGARLDITEVVHEDTAPGGDDDGLYEPTEEVCVYVTVDNTGGAAATGLDLYLTSDDPNLTITVDTVSLPDIPAGESETSTEPLEFSVNDEIPPVVEAVLNVSVEGDGDISDEFDFSVFLVDTSISGLADDMESGEGDWTHGGDNDQWHLSDWTYHSPSHAWRCGDEGSEGYDPNMDADLFTRMIYLPSGRDEGELSFFHKYGLANNDDIEVAIDPGTGWETLADFSGSSDDWIHEVFDISAYEGLVQVRFKMTTNSSSDLYGWDVDDVYIGCDDPYTDVPVYNFLAFYDDGEVTVQWSCDDYAGLVGFNLYKRENVVSKSALTTGGNSRSATTLGAPESGGGWIKLNGQLITGDSPFSYVDAGVEEGLTYGYKLEAVVESGAEEIGIRTVDTEESDVPLTYRLAQSYPNPTTGTTCIGFAIPQTEHVTLKVYNLTGQCVATLVDEQVLPGIYSVPFDVSSLADGLYIYKLQTPNYTAVKKALVSR
jgi:hypothetical protein